MCKSLCIGCSETFSLTLAAGKEKYHFPTGLMAEKQKVVGLSIRRQNASNTAKDKGKVLLTPDSVLNTAHVNITDGDKKKRLDNPAEYVSYTDSMFTCIEPSLLTLNDCYITLYSAASGFTAGHVIEVTLFYECPKPVC